MLEGSLETFALPAVLRFLTDSGAGGRLSIHAALGTGWLSIESGRVVDAGPPVAGDVTEGALALFEHRTGTFSFRPESSVEPRVDLAIPELLNLVADRRAAWEKIRAALPDDGPILAAPVSKAAPVTVTPDGWRVAVLAGGRTPAQLAAASGLSEFQACSVLLDLVAEGLISFKAQPGHGPQGESRLERPAEAAQAVVVQPKARVAEPHDDELDPSTLLRELGEEAPAPARRRR